MADRVVLVPLPDGRWLALSVVAFQAALQEGEAMLLAPERSPGLPATPETELVNAQQLAKETNLPRSTIYELAKANRIPSIRVGRHVRFQRAAVMEALNK